MCKPVRLRPDVFANLHHLPDPVMSSDGHYCQFKDVLGVATCRPSLISKRFLRQSSTIARYKSGVAEAQ